jgi:Zn-dependent M16 (insulinase) family peptidase
MESSHAFELISDREIVELNTRALYYRHVKTGAELLSLVNKDENKVFGITFRTPPDDSTGVAHIMEHSVLCGSRKYPLKEPFVELVKGSLRTFLNAFTFPDKTCYPVASQNLQDFYNLIDVYLDAVFYPLIPPQVLQQEGWHYELDDPDAPLVYKGVVFNEMKGAYSSPDSVLIRQIQHSLYPDNAYGVDSGGDPRRIPDLTYEQFKRFHDTYYHPSNTFIYFYGDDDPEQRLRLLDAYLKEFEPLPVDSQVSLQPRFGEPKRLKFPYDVGQEAEGKKGMCTVNWLLAENDDPVTSLGLRILTHILIGTPASPLRKALIDSGLGEDLAGSGLEDDLRQSFFSTGLKGIAEEDGPKVEALVLEALQALVDHGIDPDMLAASVNTIEFRLRENNTGFFPRGLLLMLRSLTTWLYGGDPIAPLAFETPLAVIKTCLQAGEPYFEGLISSYFLGNSHRTTVILEPDPQMGRRVEAAEKERLAQARQRMGETDLQNIIEQARQLKLRQATPDPPEVMATLPSLTLADLDKKNKRIPLAVSAREQAKILYHDLFTNGIAYLDLGFDLHTLPQADLPFIPLFGKALLGLGTQAEDFVKLSQRIGRSTGGIYPIPNSMAVRGETQAASWLYLRAKATMNQVDELLAILRDVLLTVNFDNPERFRQMVLEEKADQEAALVPGGHRLVNSRLRAAFDEAGWASEIMGGVSYLFFLRQLVETVEKDWPAVLARLEAIRSRLVNRASMLANVTLDAASWERFEPRLSEFLNGLPAFSAEARSWKLESPAVFEGLTIPAQVNYVGKGADLYSLGYKLDGSVFVISNYLRTTWLWERVRVQGGAYGAYVVFDQRSGVVTLLSYRDPNLLATLETFDLAGNFLSNLELGREELVKSITGAIGDMDAYQLPDAKGYTSMLRYLAGESDEFRQRLRDQVLATKVEDFHAFGEALEGVKTGGRVVVLGSADAIQAANASHAEAGWLEIKKVL